MACSSIRHQFLTNVISKLCGERRQTIFAQKSCFYSSKFGFLVQIADGNPCPALFPLASHTITAHQNMYYHMLWLYIVKLTS